MIQERDLISKWKKLLIINLMINMINYKHNLKINNKETKIKGAKVEMIKEKKE